MASLAPIVIVVAALVVVAGVGLVVYEAYFAPGITIENSQNWAGYEDQQGVSSINGSIELPPNSDWHGVGVASLWIGMGGSVAHGASQWPFWQAGLQVSCSGGACSVEMFDEGGTQGPPCNGVCPVDWSQAYGVAVGDTVTISLYGSSAGAVAVLTVDNDGFNTTYNPPPWTVLAGVTAFPSAEWIFESPQGASGTLVMPTMAAPGAVFAAMVDSAQLSDMGSIQMHGNPNGQSVQLSTLSGESFSAYSYNT